MRRPRNRHSPIVPGPAGDSLFREILHILWEAYDYADQLGEDIWDHTVELADLADAGLKHHHLRWLEGRRVIAQCR